MTLQTGPEVNDQRLSPQTGAADFTTGKWIGLGGVIAIYVLAVAAVNPFRECPVDDDWAYALTTWHFVHTGQYRLHEWLSANIPFQTLWGGMFSVVSGGSFQALRFSTIGLFLIGLIAFNALTIEHRLSQTAASLLTLCVASSSLMFRLSLSFMSDVPFFATMTLAILCYSRAVRRMTWLTWVVAGVAGAAAVLTRQFGAALVPAVAMIWLTDPKKKENSGRYLCGMFLPLLATAWQLNEGWRNPNWAAQFQVLRQKAFLFGTGFVESLPWRPTVIVEYLAWWLVPLVALAVVALLKGRSTEHQDAASGGETTPRSIVAVTVIALLLAGAVIYGWRVFGYTYQLPDDDRKVGPWMPFLGTHYDILLSLGTSARIASTLFVVIGGALFVPIFLNRWRRLVAGFVGRAAALSPAEQVLDWTMLFLLLLNLVFIQLWDQYLLVYIPYAAIVVGQQVESLLLRRRWLVTGLCVLLLVGAAIWTREDLAKRDAMWTLAERLRTTGVPPQQIYCDWQWLFYWGFENYVREGHLGPGAIYADLFGTEGWTFRNRQQAEYRIVNQWDVKSPPGETWEIVDRERYRSVYARGWETFYAVRRLGMKHGPRAGQQ